MGDDGEEIIKERLSGLLSIERRGRYTVGVNRLRRENICEFLRARLDVEYVRRILGLNSQDE